MEVKEVKISDLKLAEYNPRAMTDKEAKDLEESLNRYGMVEPIVINGSSKRMNIVIGGHQRLQIWSKLGNLTIPVVYVDISELAREQELNLRLNKNNGHWDFDMLANFDEELLKNIGFESSDLDKIFKGIKEDEPIPLSQTAISKIGELYQLGEHKLYCGDSTDPKSYEILLGGGLQICPHCGVKQ